MKNKLHALLVLGLVLATTPFAYAKEAVAPKAEHSQTSTHHDVKAEIKETFNAWLKAVSSGSSEAVMKLYAKDAVLLPTLSPKIHNTPELRKEYFDAFTAKPDLKGTVNEEHIRVFGNTAINSGLYTFSFTKDGETVEVPARFSFVYHKTPHGWLIVDHHSSKLPEVQ